MVKELGYGATVDTEDLSDKELKDLFYMFFLLPSTVEKVTDWAINVLNGKRNIYIYYITNNGREARCLHTYHMNGRRLVKDTLWIKKEEKGMRNNFKTTLQVKRVDICDLMVACLVASEQGKFVDSKRLLDLYDELKEQLDELDEQLDMVCE